MTRMGDGLEQRILASIEDLVADLAVDVEISRDVTEWGGTVVNVTPTSADSASISILVDSGGVTLGVGQLATHEMYWCARRRRRDDCVRDLTAICRVVMQQGFEEIVWFLRGRGSPPVKSEMKLEVEGKIVHFGAGGRGLSRTRKQVIRYEPYAQIS